MTAVPSSSAASAAALIDHDHADVTGGWLRPAVFGAMDGLVTNIALISGVGGGGVSPHTIVLTGVAGLVAGAISMGLGEYTSVRTQNDQVAHEVEKERIELATNPAAEAEELALRWIERGLPEDLAREVATRISLDPEEALRVHAQEELGVNPHDVPSPWTRGDLVVHLLLGRCAAAAAAVPARRHEAVAVARPGRRRAVRRRCADRPVHQPAVVVQRRTAAHHGCGRGGRNVRHRPPDRRQRDRMSPRTTKLVLQPRG